MILFSRRDHNKGHIDWIGFSTYSLSSKFSLAIYCLLTYWMSNRVNSGTNETRRHEDTKTISFIYDEMVLWSRGRWLNSYGIVMRAIESAVSVLFESSCIVKNILSQISVIQRSIRWFSHAMISLRLFSTLSYLIFSSS